MATEALALEQTAEGHVEEVKVINDVKDTDKESCPESKDLEGKDDEEVSVVVSTGAAAPATESETAVVLEVKQEDNKSEPAAEEVKKEETEVEKASDPLNVASVENEESSKQEVDSSTTEPKEEADSASVEPAVEAEGKEPKSQVEVTDTPEPSQPSSEASIENLEATLVQELEPETAKEPAVPKAAAEEVNATPEEAAEEANTTPEAAAEEANTIPETAAEEEVNTTPEAETEEANTTPEAVGEEANTTSEAAAEEANISPEAAPVEVNTAEELPQVSSVSVTESKEAEPPVVSPVTELAPDDVTIAGVSDTAETSIGETIKLEDNTESQKEEPLVTDSSKSEEALDSPEAVVSESADAVATKAVPVKELKEGEEGAVTEEVSNVPQLVEGDQNAPASAEESVSLDASPVSETIESSVKPYIKVEEMQEKAVVAEDPSDTTKTNAAAQVTDVPSEGSGGVEKVEEKKEATTDGSVESLKDQDAAVEVPQVSSEGKKASEGVEEKMDGSLEGEKSVLVETSRGINVEEAKNNVSTEADSLESEKTEKDDGKTLAESAEDAGEAPKAEVPTKSSQRNIFSKVKQSIVKVKKAIIGKSPSSKTIPTEGKDEVKVKQCTKELGV